MINTFRNYGLLLVVFIHTHIYLIDYGHLDAPEWLDWLYATFLCYFHPASILAAISGYLFYKDFTPEHRKKWSGFFRDKYLKRIKSILYPYVFWVSLFFIVNNGLIYVMEKFSPGMFVNSAHELSPGNYFKSFLFPQLAVAEHLWYLNNLLLAFAAAPLLLYLNKSKPAFVLVFCGIMAYYWWKLGIEPNQASMVIKYRFIVFFMGGAFFALNRQYLQWLVSRKLVIAALSVVSIAGLHLVHAYYHQAALLYVFNSLTVPLLIFYLVYVAAERSGFHKDRMYKRSSHFLLYIIHPMILACICKALAYFGLLQLDNYLVGLAAVMALAFLVIKINAGIYYVLSTYLKSFSLKFL